MNASEFADITTIGQHIDTLQDWNNAQQDSTILLQKVNEIESEFLAIDLSNQSADFQTIYYYTKANYLTVLLEIASRHYCKIQDRPPFSIFPSFDEMRMDYTVRRLSYFRKAIELNNTSTDSKISKTWMLQVHTNLANLYHETGRIVESITVLEPIKLSLDMALGNYAAKLYALSAHSLDESEQKETLIESVLHYQFLIERYQPSSTMPEDIYLSFCQAKEYVQQLLKHKYEQTKVYADFPDSEIEELGLPQQKYRIWCREKQLALSFRNIYQKESNVDDLHIPNMGIGYFSKDNTLSYYSWFNTLKQEFNMARYFLYLAEEGFDGIDPHESQRDILLINTLDYPAIGYRSELLKTSLKTAYGILDKVGMLCSDFVRGKNQKTSGIRFDSWYKGIEQEISLHSYFSPLYWVAKDLAYKDGSFKTFRRLRNTIEHRYLRILDHCNTPLDEELADEDKMEYRVGYSDLCLQAFQVLQLVRAVLFYTVFAFNSCYKNAISEKNTSKIFIPLTLDVYDDEWKN